MAEKRSIFEEVAEGARPDGPQGGMIDAEKSRGRTPVRRWLVALFLMVAAMILVGGLTRLTDSGLSITEWKPVDRRNPAAGCSRRGSPSLPNIRPSRNISCRTRQMSLDCRIQVASIGGNGVTANWGG